MRAAVAEGAETVRYLTARLCGANRQGRIDSELAALLMDALPALIRGRYFHGERLAQAALDALERQGEVTRGIYDEHERRTMDLYLSLGSGSVRRRRAIMPGVVQTHGKAAADAIAAHHERALQEPRPVQETARYNAPTEE